MEAKRRELRGDAGKRAPATSKPDPGDTTKRVRNAPKATAKPGKPAAKAAAEAPKAAPKAPAEKDAKADRRPRVPEWLLPEAKAEWRRSLAALERAGYGLEATDVNALAMYCSAWAQWRAIDEELRRAGTHIVHCEQCGAVVMESAYLVEGARDNAVKTPLWQLWKDAAAAVDRYAGRLGLTPESRLRMPPPPPDPGKSDPLASFGAAEPPDEDDNDEGV